jgi:hypothetical protein
MRADRLKRFAGVVAVAGIALASSSQAASTHAAPRASASGSATLATFAGTWLGHTRDLRITAGGHARESIGSGCCDPVINLQLQLSRPRGTSGYATVAARVTAIDVLDPSAFTSANPAPHLGETRRLLLRHGVITEPLTHIDYCDMAAGEKGVCGA